MTTIVLLPDGTEKIATYIGDGIVICQDGTSYYWNEYSSVTNTITAIDVKSKTLADPIPKENIGIISSISFTIDDETYTTNKASSKAYSVGGSGSGAYFSISTEAFNQYALSSYSIASGGSDYISGDNVFISPLNSMTITGVSSINRNTISSISTSLGDTSFYSPIPNIIHPTGGSGTGMILSVSSSDTSTYIVSSVSVVDGGTGYNTDDVVTIGSDCTILITDVDYGTKAITKIDMSLPTTVYDSENDSVGVSYDQNGSGTGATFNITYNQLYKASTVSMVDGGTNYKIGDVLTIDNIATITVTSTTTSSNSITSYQTTLVSTLELTEPATFVIAASGGSGYGASFTVTILDSKTYTISGEKIIDGGSGYKVGDAIKINNILSGNVTTIADGGIQTISSTTIPYIFTSIPEYSLTYNVLTGSGENFELESVTTSETYASLNYINDITISNGGSNYKVGDIIYLEDAVTIGYMTVLTVSSSGQILTVQTEFNGNPLPTSNTSYNILGGSGSGATSTISYNNISSQTGFLITGFMVVEEGVNFVKGDTISVTYNNNVISTITVDAILLSTITGISYTEIGSFSTTDLAGTYPLSGGSGTGASISLTSLVNDKIILSSIVMDNSGYDYAVGDTLTIGKYGTVDVTSVSENQKTITGTNIVVDGSTQTTDPASSGEVASGGSGSGATFSVTSDVVYTVASSTLLSGGTGYNIGDYIIVNGYYDSSTKTTYSDGGYGNVEEIALATQDVKTVSIDSSNHVLTKQVNPVSPTGGSGTGLTVDLEYNTVPTYNVTGIDLTYGGSGYSVGDIIDLGNGLGTITVTGVGDLGGTVFSLAYNINTDTSYSPTDISGLYEASGGSGNGLKLDIVYVPVPFFKIDGINLLGGGYGYKVGDSLTVNGKSITVTGIKNIISI